MTELPASPPRAKRAPYKIAGPQTWALARELYLAGLPAAEVAVRLDVSVHNLRKKATREGWSRRQHAETVLDLRLPKVGGDRRSPAATGAVAPPPFEPPEAEPPAEADPAEAAEVLVRRAAGLAQAGRADEALALLKTADALRRAAEAIALDAGPAWDEASEPARSDLPPGMRPDAMEHFLAARPTDLWAPPPRTREEAKVLLFLARMEVLSPPPGPDDALTRANACAVAFEAAEQAAAREVRGLDWGEAGAPPWGGTAQGRGA